MRGALERPRGRLVPATGQPAGERLEGDGLFGLVPLVMRTSAATRQLAPWRLHEERGPRAPLHARVQEPRVPSPVTLFGQVEDPQAREVVVGQRIAWITVHPCRREVLDLPVKRRI